MWIRDENKWMEEPELYAYIRDLKANYLQMVNGFRKTNSVAMFL